MHLLNYIRGYEKGMGGSTIYVTGTTESSKVGPNQLKMNI